MLNLIVKFYLGPKTHTLFDYLFLYLIIILSRTHAYFILFCQSQSQTSNNIYEMFIQYRVDVNSCLSNIATYDVVFIRFWT